MARPKNKAKTVQVPVAASEQIAEILDQIAAEGLIGQSGAQVALHFIQEGIMKALDNPHFNIKRAKPGKKAASSG
jgi:hypothetical protein